MPTISAVVLTKNEEEMLPKCLARLSWADEMLVVDSFSTDRTLELAEAAGARVVQHPFRDFSSQFNFGIDAARCEWVFLVDADELATPGLRDAVLAVRAKEKPEFEIYEVVRDSVVWGRLMRSRAWSDEWIPRLFRKGALRYEGEVHPKPVTGGVPRGRLRGGGLRHYTYRSVALYFQKFQLYSTLWAEKARAGGRRSGIAKATAAGLWRVFHNYVIRLEFLDGRVGFALSVLAGMHTFIRHLKLWGMEHAGELARVEEDEGDGAGR